MVDSDRRPTAQEIEELIDLVRRDPGSPAFIDLGEAYLALGRPRDAVGVANVGLGAAPDSMEGRVMLARAFAAMHQWKEAQGELLRVVKIDRNSRIGFALLGEVLMRRSDFERAVPVLQHAQNLDPTSPAILTMLKRARAGQALEAPPPLPTPVPPRGETDHPARAPQVPVASPQMRTMAVQVDPPPSAHVMPQAPPAPRAPKPTAPPPMSVEGIRPRVIARDKPQNAAAASLRQSAAVGENYLNDLLTGGLLDVAGVRVPDQEFDLRPERRWGRSTRRAFVLLFVMLVIGIGGGGTWYWWSEKQRSEAVARLQKESRQVIGTGDFAGLEASLKKLSEALQKDNANLLTFAYVVETAGLEALLYGTDAGRVDQAIKAVGKDIPPGAPGSRELMIGKAALELSRLGQGEGETGAVAAASKSTLAEVMKMLDEHLAKQPEDRWAMWLKGRAQLAAGERRAARATLKAAADGDAGLVVAMIDAANMLVDDGKIDDAFALFDKATAAWKTVNDAAKEAGSPAASTSKDHPLAVTGRALGRAEASVQVGEALDQIAVNLDKNPGPRVAAYRDLALALANTEFEDFPKAAEALRKATAQKPPGEARFWARVAWAHYVTGNLKEAATARERVVWYGKGPAEDEPPVKLVDVGLALASGMPDKALDEASKLDGFRPRMMRVYALLDLGKAKEALAEAEELLKAAPENLEAAILREQARAIASTGTERTEATNALEKHARRSKSKLGRHALGIALLATGDPKGAQDQLEQAVANITEESPNPLAYRTHTALAQILLDAGDVAGADKQIALATGLNSGYFPALALSATIALRTGDVDRAAAMMAPLVKESAAGTPARKLVIAEILIRSKGAAEADREQAKAILLEIKDQITPQTEVSRVLAMLDPKLVKDLGLPEYVEPGAESATPAPVKPAPKPKRRRR